MAGINLKKELRDLNRAQLEVARINAKLLVALNLGNGSSDTTIIDGNHEIMTSAAQSKLAQIVQDWQIEIDKLTSLTHQTIHTVDKFFDVTLMDSTDDERLKKVYESYQTAEDCLTGKHPHVLIAIPKNPGLN